MVKIKKNHVESRDWGLQWKYGISQEDYMIMLEAQKGVCKICSNPPSSKDHKANRDGMLYLHVDHDHSTGKVRGLLCKRCNTGLGGFRDNPSLLAKAALYIKESRGG